MTIKITKSQTGNRRVKLSARFNDESGHVDILNMLQALNAEGWSQSQVLHTALVLLMDAQKQHAIHPISPSAEYVSQEMLTLAQKAQEALTRTNEILALVAQGALSGSDAKSLQREVESIQGSLDLEIIEGAGSYGSDVSINDSDDEFGDW